MDILNSKLQPPGLSRVLHRNRLVELFSPIHTLKIICVVAGAGFGKTTLVNDVVNRSDLDLVWYRLATEDRDLTVFLNYLKSGFKNFYPHGFESHPPGRLNNNTKHLTTFLNALEKQVKNRTAIVLDDYHLVQDSKEINALVQFLIEQLPDLVHLILISRKELPLKLSKFRAKGQILEIDESDLAFCSDEITSFYNRICPLNIASDQIKKIHEKSCGWAASLALFHYALKDKKPDEIENHLDQLKGSQKYIFSYLEENIFETQPDEIKDFMVRISLLSYISPDFCNQVFGITTAQQMIEQMIQDHLMIFSVHGNESLFFLHHLFKDFLQVKLNQRCSRQQISQLHQFIAAELEKKDIFQALSHYIQGQAYDDAAGLIISNKIKFLIQGNLNFLGQCMDEIPLSYIEKNPQLLLTQAKLISFLGNPKDAIEKLYTALALFKQNQSHDDSVNCVIDLASQYYFTGYLREAKLLIEQVLDQVDPNSPTYVMAMTYVIFFASAFGEFDQAKRYRDQAKEVFRTYPEFEQKVANALILISCTHLYYFAGEFERSKQLNDTLLNSINELNLETGLPLAYYQYSATSFMLHEFDNGYAFAQKGIETCERIDLQDSQKGWIYHAWAQNCMGLDQDDKAIDFLHKGIDIFERPGNRWGLANSWECLCQIYLKKDQTDKARYYLAKAFDIIQGYDLTMTEGILENSMAQLLIYEKKWEDAWKFLATGRGKVDVLPFHLFRNHLMSALCCFKTKRIRESESLINKAFDLCRRLDFFRFLGPQKKWLIPLIERFGKNNPSLVQLIRNIPDDGMPCIEIQMFGKFTVQIKDRQIRSSEWKSSKALMILKYLAANRPSGFIPKEVLIELLWPDQDASKTQKRFHVAMSALRKIVEPGLSSKAASAYIDRKKDLYRLCPGNQASIDTEQFAIALKEGTGLSDKNPSMALKKLLAAESLYKGPFLEENLYDDWCIQKREQSILDYIRLLKLIQSLYQANQDMDNAVIYAKKILAADAYDESTLRKLMSLLKKTGQTTQIIKTYQDHIQKLADIDCPVSRETRVLFDDLTADQKRTT